MKKRAEFIDFFVTFDYNVNTHNTIFACRKLGGHVDKLKLVKEVFNNVGAIVKTSDFVAAEIKEQTVFSLCKQGYIERVKYGYYKLPDLNELKEEYLLSKFLIKGIVCVESALFYYGYTDFAPREWTISVRQ